MRLSRIAVALVVSAVAGSLAYGQQSAPRKKRILAIGETKGFQHDSVSAALATMWKLGKESGLWETYIKTDTQLITKKKLANNAKNLDYFDAVFFYTTGELPMDESQKADLLSFVRDDGKGFIGGHSAIDSFYKWPEYGELIGAWFDQHPWNTFDAPVIVEDRSSPITAGFAPEFTITDEIYQPSKEFSREKLHVLMRLDASKLDLKNPRVHRTDRDFAVAWVKNYGKGRVFYSTIGHPVEVYDRPDVQKMYLEAAKWCLGLTETDVSPRPKPADK